MGIKNCHILLTTLILIWNQIHCFDIQKVNISQAGKAWPTSSLILLIFGAENDYLKNKYSEVRNILVSTFIIRINFCDFPIEANNRLASNSFNRVW